MRLRLCATLVIGLLLPTLVSAQSLQSAHVETALHYAQGQASRLGHNTAEFVVVDAYQSRRSGATHVYLIQSEEGISIIGTEMTVNVNADGQVFHAAGTDRAVSTASMEADARLAPESAAAALAQHNGLPGASFGTIERKASPDGAVLLSDGGVALEPIPARLVWHQNPRGDYRLAWEVGIYTTDAQHYWLGYVDAQDGTVLAQTDLVVHDTFGPAHADGHAAETAVPSFAPIQDGVESPMTGAMAGSYTVYPMPIEAPIYAATTPPADGRTVVANPDDATASPFGWHDTNGAAGAEYTVTRGNNVHAYTDIDANNSPDSGSSPDGGASLVFNSGLNLNQAPSTYRPAAVTNLFYWNNVIHDVLYQYGFDEAAGNFQVNNYGRGGNGNDDVRAEAQDGSGTNNANFYTPRDGFRPRMQMFIGTYPNPDVDGDFDNGVIVHEYGHGISNRLTGGPSTAGCLGNIEQMGEGWSDYYAMMMTMDAADSRTQSRGMGNYLFGYSPSGGGIRLAPYTTNFGVNSYTYGDTVGRSSVHQIGFIWATILWEVTWDMIDAHGFSPDFYDANGTAGNQIMFNLVTEGMKLQPCNPGFVTGRDAILAADVNLYGGAHTATLQAAFARRGLGYSASQGSSFSVNDNSEAFDTWPSSNTPPTAGFTYSCTDLDCTFTDASSDPDGTIASRAWSFGDGGSSSATNPTHAYATGGTYTVSLTVTDDDGDSDTASQSVTVTAPSGGDPIELTAVVKTRSRGDIADLRWTPADGGKVNIYRDGVFIRKTNDDGRSNDDISALPAGDYTYRICEDDSSDCSNEATITYGGGEPPPPGGDLALTVDARTRNGDTIARLRWSPADGGQVAVTLNGTLVSTRNDNGRFNDNIGSSPSGAYTWQVCETDSGDCSNEVTLNFLGGGAATASARAVEAGVTAYPNPFNPTTTLRFGLEEAADVTLKVYNSLGREVAVLAQGRMEAGVHQATFDASALPSGVYLYRLQAGADMQTGRLMLVK